MGVIVGGDVEPEFREEGREWEGRTGGETGVPPREASHPIVGDERTPISSGGDRESLGDRTPPIAPPLGERISPGDRISVSERISARDRRPPKSGSAMSPTSETSPLGPSMPGVICADCVWDCVKEADDMTTEMMFSVPVPRRSTRFTFFRHLQGIRSTF